jgi:hypothetical protein
VNLLDTCPPLDRGRTVQAVQMHAQQLVDYARQLGLVVTITNEPQQPLAMGNYLPVVDVREARHGAA